MKDHIEHELVLLEGQDDVLEVLKNEFLTISNKLEMLFNKDIDFNVDDVTNSLNTLLKFEPLSEIYDNEDDWVMLYDGML